MVPGTGVCRWVLTLELGAVHRGADQARDDRVDAFRRGDESATIVARSTPAASNATATTTPVRSLPAAQCTRTAP